MPASTSKPVREEDTTQTIKSDKNPPEPSRMERHTNGSLNPFDELEDEEEMEWEVQPHIEVPLYERPPGDHVEHHWKAMDGIMQSRMMDPFSLEELREHLQAIEKLIIREKPVSSGRTGDCLEFLLSENVVESIYLFSTRQKVYGKEVRIMLLKFFMEVFACSPQPILIHQQILRPLSRLLRACEGTEDTDLRNALVPLLHRICILMQENQSLLDLFFIESRVHLQSKFLIFTQLISHMHELSEVSNRARDAMLLCLSLAAQLPASGLSRFIAIDCNFCQVLATGLSALYSELPTSREVTVDEWQSPLPAIETSVPELKTFMEALGFCNSVLQMAPKIVCDTVLLLVREGFLQQVMGPALFQSSADAVTFATAYLTLFLSHISNVALMREFLRYISLGRYDSKSVLSGLIQNISSSNTKLCSVTLELFYKLVDLNCEDVMLELVFKNLIPGHHVMPNQLPIVGSPDVYCQGARRFLQLLPSACVNAEKMFLDSIKGPSPQPSPEASRTSSPPPPPLLTSSPAHSSHLEKPTPLQLAVPALGASMNPFDAPLSRSRSGSDASSCSLSSSSSAPQSSLPSTATSKSGSTNVIGSYQFVYIPQTVAYLDYLEAARGAVFTCATRCKCWGNAYDRCDPPKEALMDNEVKDSKASEMEDIHVHVTHEEEDFSTSSRFRSRAVTMSHSRLSRTSSVKAHDQLKPLGDRERQRSSREDASETRGRLKHGGGSPRASPRLSRRSLDETKSRFEDTAGLLLKILLEKLSEMLQHPPHVNILLTRLIGRLAHYPQPLLRSLLLNHQLVLKPGVPNLLTVLQTIKATVDGYARTQEGFETRLARARKTMIYRAHVRNTQLEESVASQIVKRLTRQSSRISEIGDTPPLKKRGSKQNMETSEEHLARHRVHTEGSRALAHKRRKKVPTNTLFTIVVFEEFLKELAAVAQEHSVLNPLLYQPKSVT